MKEQLSALENKLAEVFKGAPKIPENGQKSIVNAMPWIALIFGVLQGLATLGLWRAGHVTNNYARELNEWASAFGVKSSVPELNIFYWVAIAFVAVSAAMLLLAYPGLKAKKKAGWNWMFYGSLVNVVYGVASLFFDKYYGGGVGKLVGSIVGAVISFWILFQIRGHYKAEKADA